MLTLLLISFYPTVTKSKLRSIIHGYRSNERISGIKVFSLQIFFKLFPIVVKVGGTLHVSSCVYAFFFRYKEQNIRCTSSYRGYDERVPKYLHNRPKDVVEHIMSRINSDIKASDIKRQTPTLFMVQGSEKKYQVWLGSDNQLPTCQCMDFKRRKLPCKHICAVVQQPDVGWESIGSSFDNYPLFSLDNMVVNTPPTAESNLTTSTRSKVEDQPSMEAEDNGKTFTSSPVVQDLPYRRKSNIRRKCIQSLKSLQDELYILTDKNVLSKTLTMLNNIISYARDNHPTENGLSLKDKSLSPKKCASKVGSSQKQEKPRSLKKRKKKNFFAKRVGAAAEARKETIIIVDDDDGDFVEGKRKAPTSLHSQQKKRKQVRFVETTDPDEDWITVQGIRITLRLKEILLNKCGWLTDEHIDAAQHLIKDLKTGVGGLNSTVIMTHRSRFALAHEQNMTIQCHNIGGHWVTSSSTTGRVIVYESLSTNLNAALKQQLISLFKGLCNEDGSLDVTVVLQQRQRGGSDCGLFSIANAVALACKVDPCSVSWLQNDMRQHLLKCFEEKKIEMFPHVSNAFIIIIIIITFI